MTTDRAIPNVRVEFTFIPSGQSTLYMASCNVCGAMVADYVLNKPVAVGDLPNRVQHAYWHNRNGV